MQETNGLEIQVLFSTDLYESQTVINMLSTFEKVLENGLLHPDVKITSLPLLSDESFSDLDSEGLIEIHQTKYARNSSIIDVFKQHVYSSPDKVAVKDSSSQLTFAELDLQSNLIACWLRKRSLNDEALVGVLSPRSCQTIVAFLGILKAHLAYLPLDVKTPAGRMEAILSSLEDEKLVLMGNEVRPPSLSLLDIKFISISDILRDQRQEDFQADFLQRFSQPSATSLAYVMFTSGSTGKPKGVMIEHRGVVRLTTKNNLVQHLNQDDTWAHMANIAFDVSTTEIYAAILNGITVVCIDHMTVLDYAALEQTFIREKIRTALFTPALLKQCLLESPATVGELTTLKMGGDRVDPQDVSAARQLVKGPIMNCYGPTENTGCSTSYTLQDEAACVNGMPIGRAISNSGAYVVDAEMRLVPVGVVGELVVTGDGLARGYLEPKQNINRFVTLTIGNAKVRAYRTGDYVRYRPTDRQLDFFGRIDGQVKIRGHRVETEEIENLLRSDPLISDAIVILHSVNDNHRLAGFVIAKRADSSNGSGGNGSIGKKQETAPEGGASEEQKLQERLRSKLEANLPPYMVPQSLTVLDAMPLNINGKIDRQALIEKIQISNNVPKTIRQPTSNAQKQMQMIWARVLSSEAGNIGLDDNFFQLGGDSILAMRVVGEARKVGTKLAVADIFRYKSLEALAGSLKTLDNAQIEQSLAKTVLIDPATKSNLMAQIDLLGIDISSKDVLNILPVTSCQRNYIVRGIAQGQYCNYIHLNLGPTLDLARFQSACITTLQRFPILRARFLYLDGRYWQVIPRHAEISLEIQDVSGDLAKFSHNFCLRDTKEFLPTQPPLGITIFKHPTQGFQMTLRISHAQYDGVCFPTILQSLSDAYEGKPLVPVLDYSRFLLYASHRRSESINYWTKLLQGSSPTVFPSNLLSDGNPRPAKPQQAETRGMVDFPSLPENITSATLVSAAWAVLLSILTGKNDVVYGHIVNGRSSAFEGVEEIVGTCLNHIPVRVNLSSHKTSTQLLNSVQNQVLDIGDSDSLGYKDIVKHCTDWGNCEKFEFNTLLHHQTIDEHPEAGLSGAKSRIEWFLNPDLVSPATITVVTYPQGDRLLVEAYGNTDAITTKMVARIPEILGKIVWDLGTRLNAPLPSRVDGIDTHH